jgi:hypothetical protein
MKRNLLFGTITLLAGSLLAADSPKNDITSAAKKLGDKANYSWKMTVAVPEGSRWRPGPTEGQAEKDGVTHLTMSFGDNSYQPFLKGEKGAVTNPDGGWQTLADMENAEGPGRFFGRYFRSFKAPAAQAADLAARAKALKQEGDAISGELNEEVTRELLSMRRAGGTDGPTVTDAKGSVKFWVKDGLLSKYEFKVQGKVSFDGNEREVDRTTTVEIKDVGSTKVEIPEEVKKQLG